jgi:hypothetical protein
VTTGGNDHGQAATAPAPVEVVDSIVWSWSSRSCQVEVLGWQTPGGGSKLRGERAARHPVNLTRIAGTFGLSGERGST